MKTATLVMMVLALFLAGCGGGGGGVNAPVSVPPVGPDEIRPVSTNPHGFDPRETWENAEAYLESLALEPASENSRTIGGHEYTAVGEKGDISYGQAKAGPTDTLDIDFIGDHWNELPQELQGVLERGGKAWSYRLSSSPRGNRIRVFTDWARNQCPEANTACGALGGELLSLKESRWISNSERVQDAATWYKREIHKQYQRDGISVEKDQAYFAAHELGHVLGLIHDDASGLPSRIRLSKVRLMGKGVNGHKIVVPHESEIDDLVALGYERAGEYPDGSAENPYEMYSFGAWGNRAAWAVMVTRELKFETHQPPTDNLVFEAIVEGERASTPLPLEDEFTWQGSLLAVDTENAEPVRGDARIELRAGDLGGTVRFTNLQNVEKFEDVRGPGVELKDWREPELMYVIQLDGTRTGFFSSKGEVSGGLYGPGHEEAAGTLHDLDYRIQGAFGGVR